MVLRPSSEAFVSRRSGRIVAAMARNPEVRISTSVRSVGGAAGGISLQIDIEVVIERFEDGLLLFDYGRGHFVGREIAIVNLQAE